MSADDKTLKEEVDATAPENSSVMEVTPAVESPVGDVEPAADSSVVDLLSEKGDSCKSSCCFCDSGFMRSAFSFLVLIAILLFVYYALVYLSTTNYNLDTLLTGSRTSSIPKI